MTTVGLDIDARALLNATAEEMNYKADGLSDQERARRVCFVQMALATNEHSPGPIDGKAGRRTERRLAAFLKAHHLEGDVSYPEVARELARALHAGVRSLVNR